MEPCLLHLQHYAYQGQQFLQYTVTRDETSVNVTPKTGKLSMMWKPITSSKKDIQSIATSKEGHDISLTSVSQSLFNGRTLIIIFYTPGQPYISKGLQAKES
jgi:hypothetical protein